MNYDLLKKQLERMEARKRFPYTDKGGKITIGIGRNLTDDGLSDEEIDMLYNNSIGDITDKLDSVLPWLYKLSDARQRAITNMTFNLGINGLMKFKKFLAFCEAESWGAAASELMDSDAARELPARYKELAAMIRTGNDV